MNSLSQAELKFQASMVIAERHTDPGLCSCAIAKQLSVSRRHLDRAFENGPTVSNLITAHRVNTAVRLLKSDSARDIDQLANRCGFTNRNTFRDQFLRIFGIQPSRARQLAQHGLASLPVNPAAAI